MGKDLKGKELGEGISQRKNGSYMARYVDRFGKRVSVYGRTRIEVKKKLQAAVEANSANLSVKKKYKVQEWYEVWMREYKEPVLRPNSIAYYTQLFQMHILPRIGMMNLEDVRQLHVQNIINSLQKDGYQWGTANKIRILIQDLFNVAILNDFAIKNPAKGVKVQKGKAAERIVLDYEQQEEFFECCAGTFYDNLFTVAMNTGLRQGELCALEASDLDFARKEISITKTLIYQEFVGDAQKRFHVGPPKTETSVRTVPMNEECEKALRKQIHLKKVMEMKNPESRDFPNLLFVTRKNTPICVQIINDAIKKIVDEINLQRDDADLFPVFSSHTFRHTFATRCIEAGIQPKTLQKYLGHASLQMTMDLYVHLTETFKQEEFKKLDAVMPKKKITRLQIVSENGVRVG